MNSIKATDFLNHLLCQDVEIVREWLTSIIENKTKLPDNFNWLGLAEVAASRARKIVLELTEKSLQWAEISIATYEILDRIDTSVRSGDSSYTNSAMWLRVYLIGHLGFQNDRILNPQIIFDWFFSSLEISCLEACQKSQKWRLFLFQKQKCQLNYSEIQEILQLRRIREKLKFIKFLLESYPELVDKDVSLWLSIEDNLL
ncbi:hypothetical protein IQ235_11450 [Oscillatoriales cyanobacterium LEGE 11467]|uniref:Uncharacterized protein n=1 Tax=Zarconia navalis LEGE 11467 TaxID=1828826 RepID=A0A928VW88_9CYAN|nr:hypothetical protein [Zarconia navalis]MBE9041397.1 hypothetical protein [Zarconia navalis LEGE 11467]